MPRAIRIEQTGGPEVMQYVEVDAGTPGRSEARVHHQAIGLTTSTSISAPACTRWRCPPVSNSRAPG